MCRLYFAFHLDLSRTLLLHTRLNIAKCTQKKNKRKTGSFQANRGRQIAESLQQLPVCHAKNILEMIHYRPVFFSWIRPDFRGQPGCLLSLTKWSISLWGGSTVACIRARCCFSPRFYFQLAVFTNENRRFALGGKWGALWTGDGSRRLSRSPSKSESGGGRFRPRLICGGMRAQRTF